MEKELMIGIGLAAFVALVVSVIIFHQETAVVQNPFLNNVCAVTRSNCQAVQESIYGNVFGIDNAVIGMVGYSLLLLSLLIWIVTRRAEIQWIVLLGSLIAGLMSLRFLYLQAFVLKEYCIFCVAADSMGVILLALGITALARAKKANSHR